jgi:hypothetical protein
LREIDVFLFSQQEGLLAKPIRFLQWDFYHMQKIADYPYMILTGIDKAALHKDGADMLLVKFQEALIFAICALGFLFIFRRTVVSPLTKLAALSRAVNTGKYRAYRSKKRTGNG